VAYLKTLLKNSSGETKQIHEKPQSGYPVTWPRIEIITPENDCEE